MEEKCSACGGKAVIVRGDYQFVESGLPGVLLRAIELLRCGQCGNEEPIIPRLESVLRSIALAVARKGHPLEGREISLLRTYAERPIEGFAELLGVEPGVLEQWESGAASPPPASDRLIRLVALSLGDGLAEYVPELVGSLGRITTQRQPLRIEIDLETMQYRYAA